MVISERPEVERKNYNPNKKIVAQRSMLDVIEEGRSSGGGSVTSFANGDVFKQEVMKAMGKSVNSSITTPSDEYRTPQHALEAYENNECSISDMPGIIAKLGIVSEEEVSDMTPKQAFAALKNQINEDEEQVCEKDDVKKPKEPFKKGQDYPGDMNMPKKKSVKTLTTVSKKNASDIKVSLKKPKKIVKSQAKNNVKKTVKKAKKKVKSQVKNPYMQPTAPAPAPAPQNQQVIEIPDPVTGEVKKYMKQADGTLIPQTVVASKVIAENPPKSVQDLQQSMDGQLDSAVIEKEESMNTDLSSKNERHYTAKLNDNKWTVFANNDPVFTVSQTDAFPGQEEEHEDIWNDKGYGEELATACKLMGVTAVINDTFKGHVKIEAEKTNYDYEADLVSALEANDPKSDVIMKEYITKYPEKSKSIVALYNDKSIPTDKLGNAIRQAIAKRTAQFDDSVSNVENDIEQEPAAVMTPENAAESVKDDDNEKNVIDLLAEVLAPIIAATDVWDVDEAIVQLKETFENDEAIASFKGSLEEKIKQDEEKSKTVIEEKSEEELKAQEARQNKELEQYKTAMKKKLQTVRASLNKLHGIVVKNDNKKTASMLNQKNSENKDLNKRIALLSKELDDAKSDVDRLLKERSARFRYPRAKKLAEKMEKIGIKTPVQAIMLYTDTQFEEKTKEVDAILNTVGDRRVASNERLISGGLPATSEKAEETIRNPFKSSNPGFTG